MGIKTKIYFLEKAFKPVISIIFITWEQNNFYKSVEERKLVLDLKKSKYVDYILNSMLHKTKSQVLRYNVCNTVDRVNGNLEAVVMAIMIVITKITQLHLESQD